MIWTVSACPVRPVLTVSYWAVLEAPPEYPEVALMTPLTCSNTAWIPQKQPPASTAVCLPGAAAKPSFTRGPGMLAVASAALHDSRAASGSRAKRPARLRRERRNILISFPLRQAIHLRALFPDVRFERDESCTACRRMTPR